MIRPSDVERQYTTRIWCTGAGDYFYMSAFLPVLRGNKFVVQCQTLQQLDKKHATWLLKIILSLPSPVLLRKHAPHNMYRPWKMPPC